MRASCSACFAAEVANCRAKSLVRSALLVSELIVEARDESPPLVCFDALLTLLPISSPLSPRVYPMPVRRLVRRASLISTTCSFPVFCVFCCVLINGSYLENSSRYVDARSAK